MCNTGGAAHSLLPAAYVFIGLTLGFIFLGCKSGKSYFLRSSGIPVLLAKVSQSLFSSFQEDTPQILSQSDRLPKLKLHFNDLKLESLALLIDGLSSCKILSTTFFSALPWKCLIDLFQIQQLSFVLNCQSNDLQLESLAYSLSHSALLFCKILSTLFFVCSAALKSLIEFHFYFSIVMTNLNQIQQAVFADDLYPTRQSNVTFLEILQWRRYHAKNTQ